MNYVVNIRSHQYKKSILILNDNSAKMLNLINKKRGYISFGTEKNFVDIIISEEAEDNEILLSEDNIKNLYIPLFPIYEIVVEKNQIIIKLFFQNILNKNYSV